MRTYHLLDYAPANRRITVFRQKWPAGMRDEVHRHDCIEIIFVLKGSGVNTIDARSYPIIAGDIYRITRASTHQTYTAKGLEFFTLLFDPALFTREEAHLLQLESGDDAGLPDKLTLTPPEAAAVRRRIEEMERFQRLTSPDAAALGCRSSFLLLLLELSHRRPKSAAPGAVQIPEGNDPEDTLARLLRYLHRSFRRPEIGVAELAGTARLSTRYVGEFFRVNTGTTPGRYLRTLRIEEARRLFDANPAAEVESVALACGFRDAGYFTRVFRRLTGETPSAYKKRKRNNE